MTAAVGPGELDANLTTPQHRSLIERLSARRRGSFKIPLQSLFLTLGALCLPIGIVVIVLGWYGAAHTGHLYEQNDYLISGGLLGLGIVFIGGFLYFGHWMTEQIRATETGTQETLRVLSRIDDKLSGLALGDGASGGAAGIFVVTEHGSMLHRPTCPVVADKNVRILTQIDSTTYRACTICLPD